jgi:hypothetical protein
MYAREKWDDHKKPQGDFSIWTKQAQCSVVCFYPQARIFQVLPETSKYKMFRMQKRNIELRELYASV